MWHFIVRTQLSKPQCDVTKTLACRCLFIYSIWYDVGFHIMDRQTDSIGASAGIWWTETSDSCLEKSNLPSHWSCLNIKFYNLPQLSQTQNRQPRFFGGVTTWMKSATLRNSNSQSPTDNHQRTQLIKLKGFKRTELKNEWNQQFSSTHIRNRQPIFSKELSH